MRKYYFMINILLSLLSCFNFIQCIEYNSPSKQPTNQPSYFEAPSIPKDIDSFVPIPDKSNNIKDTHGTGMYKADNLNEELEEETKTAINGVTYIFYTFIIMVICVFGAYLWKNRPNSADNMKIYQPVESSDNSSEYFSRRNVELT